MTQLCVSVRYGSTHFVRSPLAEESNHPERATNEYKERVEGLPQKEQMISSRGISSLPLKALFISLIVHLAVLNVFIFTVPLPRETFKPAFIFLGSILKQKDVGDISSSGERTDEFLPVANDFFSEGAENFLYSPEGAGRRFIQGASREPVSPGSVGTREKIVRKTLFDIPAGTKQERVEPVADSIEADHEIAPYRPLGLFSR